MLHQIHFFKYFYILTLSFFLYNCQLKIPFKYFPVYNYNYSSPSQIMESIIQQKLYANIEIGTPKKTIQIPLFFNSNDFYISDCPKKEFESGTFSDLKFYNQSDSTTNEDLDDYEDYYAYNGELFEVATYHKDRFYFNNNNYELEFYIPTTYKEVNSGGIGMLLLPYSEFTDSTPNIEKSFFGKLKKKKLINQYYWSIFFNSREYKKEEEGFILLGILPHEIDGDLGLYQKGYFNEKYIKTVNMADIRPYIKNTFEMDMIYAYEGNNKNKVIVDFPSGNNDYRKVELDYHSGGVKAPANLRQYYHRVFEKYFANGECFNDTLKRNSYTFYYCKNNKDTISKIKSVFPGVNLLSRDLTYNFTLEADDLFVEEKDYVFCLLYFSSSSSDKIWLMGKPFLRKYLFIINYEQKYFSFYYDTDKNKEDKGNNGISPTVLWIVVCVTVVLVSIICFLVFRFYLYEKLFRKKRANELDEDFEYTAKGDNYNCNINS